MNFRWTSSWRSKFSLISWFFPVSTVNGRSFWLWPNEDRRGLATQFTLHLCKLYQTGESAMAPTQREPEQKHDRRKISQACRIDLLDSGVWAEQWEPEKSVSVSLPLTVSAFFRRSPVLCFAAVCKSQHVLLSNRKAQNKYKSITIKDKVTFHFEFKSISRV